MTYYHVRITRKSDQKFDEVKLDLSLEELEQRILQPYKRGIPVTIQGSPIPSDDIHRVRIGRTAKSSSNYYGAAKSRQSDSMLMLPPSVEWYIANLAEDVTDTYITGPPGHDRAAAAPEPRETQSQIDKRPIDKRKVFIVHGRNGKARDALFAFLRAIGLHPLEWSEAVKATGRPSPYIGEVLDQAFSTAQAAVVLFTPDDEARLKELLRSADDPPHETELTGQARPNVLFEAGMAMGRNENRTILVELGSLRPFSDIAGRHTIRLDNTSQRRQELAQRLQAADCPVNLDGVDWHTAGDFDAALSAEEPPSMEKTRNHPVSVSKDAVTLLCAAAEDAHGTILMLRTMGGVTIQTNGREFTEAGSRRSEARWEGALNDLVLSGLVRSVSDRGEVFEVTREGYALADTKGTQTSDLPD